jgi:hypothetical protein
MINAIIRSEGPRKSALQGTVCVLVNLWHWPGSALEGWPVTVEDIAIEFDGGVCILHIAHRVGGQGPRLEVLVGEGGGRLGNGRS